LRPPHARVVQQELAQPALLVAPADSPDGGAMALQARCDIVDGLAPGDSQDDAGMLDLEPRQATTAGNGLQDRPVRRRDSQRGRLSAAHGGASE
jgi:hypothetical protein